MQFFYIFFLQPVGFRGKEIMPFKAADKVGGRGISTFLGNIPNGKIGGNKQICRMGEFQIIPVFREGTGKIFLPYPEKSPAGKAEFCQKER